MTPQTALDPTRRGPLTDELSTHLHHLVVGQDEAVDQIIQAYQLQACGLAAKGRPLSSFLFLGPTGTGKTRVVEAMAECLFHTPQAVVKVDCSEFQHGHEIAKLIGSPPGYLGHRETTAIFTQANLNQHQTESNQISLVLFDEIEKASDSLWNLLLGVLDKATLTLGDNKRVDFSRSMIFMTSNLGVREINNALDPALGFATRSILPTASIDRVGREAARRKFTPEFLNRIDHTVVFHPLGQAHLDAILDLELSALHQRIAAAAACHPELGALVLSLSTAARAFLLQEGTDAKYGARHLKRALERHLMHPIANILASGQVIGGSMVYADLNDGHLSFTQSPLATINAVAPTVVAALIPPTPARKRKESHVNPLPN